MVGPQEDGAQRLRGPALVAGGAEVGCKQGVCLSRNFAAVLVGTVWDLRQCKRQAQGKEEPWEHAA